MSDHLAILQRVGRVLIVIGVLDIGVMIYCIANQISYSSSFNIFAVVAGIYLVRGHLGATKYVTWFNAFFLSAMLLGCFTVFPWIQPLDYWLFILRHNPLSTITSFLFVVAFIGILLWVYQQMRSPVVVAARVAAGQSGAPPILAFVVGALLAVLLGVMLQLTLNGSEAEEAKRRASEQYGADYKYFVSSINYGNDRVSARLVGYKDGDVKEVEIKWEK